MGGQMNIAELKNAVEYFKDFTQHIWLKDVQKQRIKVLLDLAQSVIEKGGKMKRSIQECEDLDDYADAMADAWREDQRVQAMLETGSKGQ